ERAAGHDADLLTEHRPHDALERVPDAGYAQSRVTFHQRSEQRIRTDSPGDLIGICSDVEHPSRRRRHLEECRRLGAADVELQRSVAIEWTHVDQRGSITERDRAGIAL